MSGVLARYLRRRIAGQTLALLAVLTALMQVLELLDVTTDILDRQLGVLGMLRYAALRTPSELVVALPLAALLGTMSALYAMARNHEFTAIRCAGLSLRRLFVLLLPVPLLFALAQFVIAQTLVPAAETGLKAWWDATAPAEEAGERQWVRTRTGPLSFERASTDGRTLGGLQLYLPDADGQFVRRISAQQAQWNGRGWTLRGIEELDVGATVTRTRRDSEAQAMNLRPDDVQRLDLAEPHLSSLVLADLIAGERAGTRPLSYYRTVLLRSYTAPLAALIMLLLAMPSARASSRSGGGGALLVALALGLGFQLCDGIVSALGTSGRVPALLAAIAAPLLFGIIGLAQLHRLDRQ